MVKVSCKVLAAHNLRQFTILGWGSAGNLHEFRTLNFEFGNL